MPRKRRSRKVQYFPELVTAKILNSVFLRTLVYTVYTAKTPITSGDIAKQISRLLGRNYSPGYVSVYLKRLEKWGVVRPYRDPTNGHLLWWRTKTRTFELIAQEIRKQEMKKLLEAIE